jgi:hypothetical protein
MLHIVIIAMSGNRQNSKSNDSELTDLFSGDNSTDKEDKKETLRVSEIDVLEQAFAQFKEADGGHYPMKVREDEFGAMLVPATSGEATYDDQDKISAYDVCEWLTFDSNCDEYVSAEQAIQNFSGLVDEIEINGTEYKVQ